MMSNSARREYRQGTSFLCALAFLSASCIASARSEPPADASKAAPGSDGLPRKVVIGTFLASSHTKFKNLSDRLTAIEELIDGLAAQAQQKYPRDGLDLVILPEAALSTGMPGKAPDKAVRFAGEVAKRMGAKARQYNTYLIVTMILAEGEGKGTTYSNVAVLLDRSGKPVGIYRKVHPVAYLNSDELEGGVTPGDTFPVFDCDFGRLGIQICWDMSYEDGWEALDEKGAEIIALPTASAQTVRPASYALRGRCYIVTSTGKNNASIFNPIGRICAQTTEEPFLVHQVDLSYAILHWSPPLLRGKLLKDKYGDRVDFEHFVTEGTGVYWSNDPGTSIREMIREVGLEEMHEQIARNKVLQDAARRERPPLNVSAAD